MLSAPPVRYLLVGGLCAAVHNAIMIGGAALGVHYAVSSVASYLVVIVLGFLLHSHFTFSVGADLRSFVKYAAALSLNYPIWLVLMFLLNDRARLPMAIASPVGTVLMLAWNFAVSRWAILKPAGATAGTRPGEAP